MKRLLLGSSFLCSALVLSALSSGITPAKASDDDSKLDAVLQRLDKLEKENSTLRTEIKRFEGKAAVTEKRAVKAEKSAEAAMARAPAAEPYPVKGRVLYVRECQMYGPGFFYIPGSPGCMKIGGYARLQGTWGASGDGIVTGADSMAGLGRLDRTDSNNANYEARAVMSLDVRYPTEMGVLRGYVRGGFQNVTPSDRPATPSVFWDRGYMEFMGFTAGKQRSFFDIFAASNGYLTYGNLRTTGDTDLTGVILAAYTYRWGNGVSSSLSVEDPGGHYKVGVGDLNSVAMTPLGVITPSNGYVAGALNSGMGMPDIIANLRVDKSWGYVGISGALHQLAGGYYSGVSSAGGNAGCSTGSCFGHPSDKFGGAVALGGNFFVPTGRADTLGVNLVYSEGAVNFATKGNVWQLYGNNQSAGFAWGFDGVYDNITPNCPVAGQCPSAIERTKAWSINAGFEHHWNDEWKTSAYGGYAAVLYNQAATNLINQHLPSPPAGGTACGMPVEGIIQPPIGVGSGLGNSCSPNYSFFQVGSRTQYNPTPWLDLGVDVTYTRLYTAYKGLGNPTALAVISGVALPANGAQPAGLYTISNQDVFTVVGRAQINFYPGQ